MILLFIFLGGNKENQQPTDQQQDNSDKVEDSTAVGDAPDSQQTKTAITEQTNQSSTVTTGNSIS